LPILGANKNPSWMMESGEGQIRLMN
jgi:hypothetical protein